MTRNKSYGVNFEATFWNACIANGVLGGGPEAESSDEPDVPSSGQKRHHDSPVPKPLAGREAAGYFLEKWH